MIKKLKVNGIDVFLENFGEGEGKLTVSGFGINSSYYWGSMSSTLEEFILRIDKYYFANKMSTDNYQFDPKATFTNVRKYLKTEVWSLNGWYTHMEFQKDLREKLNEFQESCESAENFVYGWDRFIRNLDFYLVPESDRLSVRCDLEGIDEVWFFIENGPSDSYKYFLKFHDDLKKAIKKNKFELFEKIVQI